MMENLPQRSTTSDGLCTLPAASSHSVVSPQSKQLQLRSSPRKPIPCLVDENQTTTTSKRSGSSDKTSFVTFLLGLAVVWSLVTVRTVLKPQQNTPQVVVNTLTGNQNNGQRFATVADDNSTSNTFNSGLVSDFELRIPAGFHAVLERATQHMEQCRAMPGDFRGFDTRDVLPFHNGTIASLPAFGIASAIKDYFAPAADSNNYTKWPVCQMPPLNECVETQLTVIFMAYNHDRLGLIIKPIRTMLDPKDFRELVKEIVLVWNGEERIDKSRNGVELLKYTNDHPFRIVYPLKMGFPNDLMNRYHPDIVQPTTKALLYFDDDGPFFSHHAIQSGFELWKRHATAQVGAMGRHFPYSKRQQEQLLKLSGAETATKALAADDKFVSHCTNVDDQVDYQFRFFANYDANMVLPSGSILHANYLCYLWHPAFADIRRFVLDHPAHPDDMTVSMIVSQLAGVAPRVYSRRLSPQDKNDGKIGIKKSRRLLERVWDEGDDDDDEEQEEPIDLGIVPLSELQRRRSLLLSICWHCGSGMTEMKQYWAELRIEAINSLVRYFGSLNSGSIGWCAKDSQYYNAAKDGRCDPVMAKQGWLPWMNSDGSPKDTCP